MARQITFEPRGQSIDKVVDYHMDTETSLRLFYTDVNPNFLTRFFGYNNIELETELVERLEETDLRSSFAVLSRLEAIFRIDYRIRCIGRKRDSLSRAFHELYRTQQEKVGLESDIFETWKSIYPGTKAIVSELKGAFRYRHWLSHGSYWSPNLGRKYGYDDLYTLAVSVLSNLPLYTEK